MALPWADTTGFHIAPCLPCCTGSAPTECACALLIPSNLESRWGNIYGSYAAAAAFIANRTSNCIGYGEEDFATPLTTFTADNFTTPGTLTLAGTSTPATGAGMSMYSSLTVAAGNLTIAFTKSGGDALAFLYDCSMGATVFSDSGSSSPFVFTGVPAGTYVLEVVVQGAGGITSTSGTFTITHSTTYVVNPVIALWDDSGTTRQLEACPKMLLPFQTEATGSWYSSLASAQEQLLHYVSTGCLAFTDTRPTTFTASFAAGTFSLTAVGPGASPSPVNTVFQGGFSLNAEAGETLTFTYTLLPGVAAMVVRIYDYTGTLIETLSGASPLVSSALPYTGRYFFQILAVATMADIALSLAVTSSGSISANMVQILYDVGLDCPARLDCTEGHTYTPTIEGGGGGDEL